MFDIVISTAGGRQYPKTVAQQTLRDLLNPNSLPPTMFQAYIDDSGTLRPIPVDTRVRLGQRYVLRCNRNLKVNQILPGFESPHWGEDVVVTVAVPNADPSELESFNPKVISFTVSEAREIVAHQVAKSLEWMAPHGTILAGLSGGGDSNAMSTGLARWRDASRSTREMQAFTLMYAPIWPATGTGRAAALCDLYGFKHHLVEPAGIEEALKIKTGLTPFLRISLTRPAISSIHIFATYLVSTFAHRWLLANVPESATRIYCLGYNREDVIADTLFSLINGNVPLSYPVRRFGKCLLAMPAGNLQRRY